MLKKAYDVVIIDAEKRLSLLLFTTTFCVGSRIITISQRHQKHVDVSVDQWGRVVKNRSNASKLPQIFFFFLELISTAI